MRIFYKKEELRSFLASVQQNSQTIGFVPTMGALHQGHISLLEKAKQENDLVVVSIFVNPIQFNDPKDLEKYPRNLQADAALIEAAGCDVLFAPDNDTMYPGGIKGNLVVNEEDGSIKGVDLGPLDKVMEGAHRPGHFKGVMVVVKKLFDIVCPDKAYFGQKDFQQVAVINEMVRQLKLPVQIINCPIIREKNGLAMSSRNMRLSEEDRKRAGKISAVLFAIQEQAGKKSVKELQRWGLDELSKEKSFQPEYLEIVRKDTLQPIDNISVKEGAVVCVALRLGGIRLIDNVILS